MAYWCQQTQRGGEKVDLCCLIGKSSNEIQSIFHNLVDFPQVVVPWVFMPSVCVEPKPVGGKEPLLQTTVFSADCGPAGITVNGISAVIGQQDLANVLFLWFIPGRRMF